MTERDKYLQAEYPYDFANCGFCILAHKVGQCDLPEHAELVRAAIELLRGRSLWSDPNSTCEVFTNLRELFREFYQAQVEPSAQPEVAVEAKLRS